MVHKYAIMSDVHANPMALEAALADARAEGCDKFILVGDVVGYGYEDKLAVDLVRDNFDVVVRGNHEECSDFDETLSDDVVAWLSMLPARHCEGDFCCLHGHAYDPSGIDGVTACTLDNGAVITGTNPEVGGVRLTFCGHTHHAVILERGRDGSLKSRFCDSSGAGLLTAPESVSVDMEDANYIVNCGSVGHPRTVPASTYAIYDCQKKRITIRSLPFDFGRYIDGFVSRGIEIPFVVLEWARMGNAV